MLTNEHILCISSIDWDFIWQGHQEIMSTLARNGNRVLFVENTGVRAPGLKDISRLRHRLQNWLRSTKGFRTERENLFVYSPVILPFPYSRIARRINRSLLTRAIQRWMKATGSRRPIVWTFLPTPLTLDLIHRLDPELTVYYCIDDFSVSSPAARRIARSETQLFREADAVFVTSQQLREKAEAHSSRVHVFPFGVDFQAFEQVRLAADSIPEDLRAIRGPVVGYVGGVHQWIDQDLLAAVAERLPEISFVLIGPVQTDVARLRRLPNIHLLGQRSHADVPRYIKGFQAGVVPYRLSPYTMNVYPTKLNEYLAMGVPTVATDLPELRRFNREYGDVVSIARSAEEFAEALRRVMAERSPEAIVRRIDVAKKNSWSSRVEAMSGLIETQLVAKRDTSGRWQESLRRLYRAASRRLLRTVVGLAVIYVLLFRSPFIWWMAAPLRVDAPPRRCDAVVVLAGGVGESGEAGGGYQERVRKAVELYQQGFAPHLVFSSGYRFVFREAEIMKGLALSLGVPASAIVLETQGVQTEQQIRLASDILRARGWRSALLVSSPYHMRRAVWTFRMRAPDIEVVPAPVPRSQFYIPEQHGGASLEQVRAILHEYLAIVVYWWKGWLKR